MAMLMAGFVLGFKLHNEKPSNRLQCVHDRRTCPLVLDSRMQHATPPPVRGLTYR